MPSTLDWQPGNVIQAGIYGASGVGKSWLALTFPRCNVIDFDHGIAVARNPQFVEQYGLRDIMYEQFKERSYGAKGVPQTHNAFDDACKYFDECMKPAGSWKSPTDGKLHKVGRDMFDTWVVDSGTSLSDAAIVKAIILLGGPQFGKNGMSQTFSQALQTGLVFPKIQDYGAERSMVEQFIRMVKDSGKNVVFLMHEKEAYNQETGLLEKVTPLLTGKSPEVISAMFDNIWHLRVMGIGSGKRRTLVTDYDGIRYAKSRIGVPSGNDYDYTKIKQIMDGIANKQISAVAALRNPQSGITPAAAV